MNSKPATPCFLTAIIFSLSFSSSHLLALEPEDSWPPAIRPIPAPTEPHGVPLSKRSDYKPGNWVQVGAEIWLQNVSHPSLIPYLAERKSPGPALLIIPGGGFKFISMSNEGWPIAEEFAKKGISTFILKYRVDPSPTDPAAFKTMLLESFAQHRTKQGPALYELESVRRAREDADAALLFIREHATDWNIDRNRIGVLGFSAGAITAISQAAASRVDSQPNFIAALYGSLSAVPPPEPTPPLFFAVAADDPLFEHEDFALLKAWHASGGSTELHWYANGGHGFGSRKQGTTSDLWADQFMSWLRSQNVIDADD